MTKKKKKVSKVQGEGDYESARRYTAGVEEYLETHDVEAAAEEAKEAVDEDDEGELTEAERKGKARRKD